MMKIKKKGKVHPSPSSSKEREVVVLSVLRLLPAAILSLASVLSLEDQQVLAYMLTRSLKTTTSTDSSSNNKKKPSRKSQTNNNNHVHGHNKPPMFDCECFDCYTSFWVRWDTSPNRDLIHRVIEAFEDHLASDERPNNARPNKKRSRSDKLGRRQAQNPTAHPSPPLPLPLPHAETTLLGPQNAVVSETPEVVNEGKGSERQNDAVEEAVVSIPTVAANGTEHRGLARKVLPDVLGLLNSRLWGLWSPNA